MNQAFILCFVNAAKYNQTESTLQEYDFTYTDNENSAFLSMIAWSLVFFTSSHSNSRVTNLTLIGNPQALLPWASSSVAFLIWSDILLTSKSSFAFYLAADLSFELVAPCLDFSLNISQWKRILINLSPTATFHLVVILTAFILSSWNF